MSDSLEVAEKLLRYLARGDFRAAWALYDPELRELLASRWILKRLESPLAGLAPWTEATDRVSRETVADLASAGPTCDAWDAFAEDQLAEAKEALGGREWEYVWSTKAGDDELVLSFVERGTEILPGARHEALNIRLRLTDAGWRYAGTLPFIVPVGERRSSTST